MENKTVQLKDYLHLYLGCDCYIGENRLVLNGAKGDECHVWFWDRPEMHFWAKSKNVKLVLRPLSDMTEEEKVTLARMSGYMHIGNYNEDGSISNVIPTDDFEGQKCLLPEANYLLSTNRFYPEVFIWLLSKHFDLFNLIESGAAIDSTTINQP